jgi:hypothetical protein
MGMSDLLLQTAYHEAGHAVMGYRFRTWIRDGGVTVDFKEPGKGGWTSGRR